jgi:hypothetical protein
VACFADGDCPSELSVQTGQIRRCRRELSEGFIYWTDVWNTNDIETARILNDLAFLYYQQGKFDRSARSYQWALASTEGAVGSQSGLLAACMRDYAHILRAMGKTNDAGAMETQAAEIIGVSSAATNFNH